MREITITANDAGRRLDRFLRKYLSEASLGDIYKFIRKDVKVEGRRKSESYILNEGEILSLYIPDDELVRLSGGKFAIDDVGSPTERARRAEGSLTIVSGGSFSRNFELVYEDDNILIANKPYGLLTHGDRYEKKDHLANRVKDYLIASGAYNPRVEKVFTPAPVNRLDRNTTGIVLFGKTSEATRELTRIIREDEIRKIYLTVVCGEITEDVQLAGSLVKDEAANRVSVTSKILRYAQDDKMNAPDDRMNAPDDRLKSQDDRLGVMNDQNGAICHSEEQRDEGSYPGKYIETIVRPVELLKFGEGFSATLCEIELVTGRSHQIRAHLASLGHPLIGDSKYAIKKSAEVNCYCKRQFGLSTQLLHAYRIEFKSRSSQNDAGCLDYLCGRTFDCELPTRFAAIYRRLGGNHIKGNVGD